LHFALPRRMLQLVSASLMIADIVGQAKIEKVVLFASRNIFLPSCRVVTCFFMSR